jgi:putative ABC transport system ATP-binding protein
MVKAHNIGKSFGEIHNSTKVLSKVNLELSHGDFAAVQGPSGCGKSTLMLILGGLLRPSEGSVSIDDKDVFLMSDASRTRFRSEKIGFIFQEFYLVPYLSVFENIVVAAAAINDKQNTEKRAWELINRFSINHRATHLPEKLSTGEKQRTALCRALINGPSLLLADEPTGNLDAENASKLCDCFDAFAKDGGAVLMVTHDKAVAARASRLMKIENGAVVNVSNRS